MQLIVASTNIKQDSEGRYCLNDLHKASGGESRHQPGKWLSNKQTDELIKEYEKTGIPVIAAKQQLGTFVAKDLVYDYAMWISPAFKVKVIQTFDAVSSGRANLPTLPQTFAEALRLAADQAEQIALMAPKAEFFDTVTGSKTAIDMALAAKTLNLPFGRNTLFNILRSKGVLDGRNIPYQQFCNSGYFRVVESTFEKPDGTVCVSFKTVVYQKGLEFIRRKLAENAA
jgi:phage antirepressor YoqD-like protein